MRKIVALLAMVMLTFTAAMAQTRPITGKVTDDKNQPVDGASVQIKGTTTGVAALTDGSFRINAKTGDVLVISATNFATKEVTIGTGSNYNVQVARTVSEIEAVVVTTALGRRSTPRALGYATATVNNQTLNQGKSVNIQQGLTGKVSGLNITSTNSGVFENSKLLIRGIRSLTGNNQPMLVVDGVPTPLGYLSSIPGSDVQDVSILKSAAAAALYGPDGVNGVILITTKRGTKGKPTITLSSTVQLTKVAYFPKLQKRFGSGSGEDAFGNPIYTPYENQQYGPEYDGSTVELGKPLEDGSVQMVKYSSDNYKEKKKFYNTGVTFQNEVSFATDEFYMSVQDAKIKGLVPSDENRRTSFRFNASKKYGKFSTSFNLNYIQQNWNVINESALASRFASSYNGSLFFLVLQTANHVPLTSYKNYNTDKFAQYSNYYNEYSLNPYWAIDAFRQTGREDDVLGSMEANYQITDWLKATARIGTSLAFSNFKNSTAPIFVSDYAAATRGTQYKNYPGSVADGQTFSSRINVDYYLDGNKKIGSDFDVKYLAGGQVRQNRSKDMTVTGNNLIVPYLYNVANRSGEPGVAEADVTNRLYSVYGSAGISYKNWAFIEGTARNDWDSRLAKENRSFFYPAVNASIVLSDAIPAIKNSATVSYFKLRGAISKSGQVNLGTYALEATYAQTNGFPYGSVPGYSAGNVKPSADLKPEFVNTKEVGFELGLFKERVRFEASYFHQNNTDQVLQISQSSTSGYPVAIANAADFKNYGVEMDLTLSPVIKINKGRIDLKVNATYNNNEVTKTFDNTLVNIGGSGGFVQGAASSPTASNVAVVGLPAFAFQMTDYKRDDQGRVIVDASTGLPVANEDLVIKGRSLPLWVVGFTPSYSVGNFSVSMTWDYKGGHQFYSGIGSDMDFTGISERSAAYGRKRFVFPNSVYDDGTGKLVPNTNIQVQSGGIDFWTSKTANAGVATNYFANASALRLRELNISYTLPAKWLGNGRIFKSITVSAVGRNLLMFLPDSNQWADPEFNYSSTNNTFGINSSFQTPSSRLFGGTVTVRF